MKRSGKGKKAIVPFFLTHAGCGSRCSYCDQVTITGVSSGLESAFDDFRERIRSYQHAPGEIALYGGDILNLPAWEIVRLLDDVKRFLIREIGGLPAMRLSSSPRSITREKLMLLRKYNFRVIEVGAVSTSRKVLRTSQRGYEPEDAIEAVRLTKEMGFEVGVQFVTGLPGDSIQAFEKTLSGILSQRPHFAILCPLVILAGTELGRNYRSGLFHPPEKSYIVRTALLFLLSLRVWHVRIGRIGLHEADTDRSAVLYSSFPGNLRQEAEGELYRLMVEYLIRKNPGLVTIQFGKKRETSVRGKKNVNLRKILAAYPQLSGRVMFNLQGDRVVGRSNCGRLYEVKGEEKDFFAFARNTVMREDRA